MDAIEIEYIITFAEIMCDQTVPQKVAGLRLNALKKLFTQVRSYQRAHTKSNMIDQLITAVWDKKLAGIMDATTKEEMDEILEPSASKLTYAGTMVPTNPRHHVEEEELLIWVYLSPSKNLIPEARERILELFRKIFPEAAKEWDI